MPDRSFKVWHIAIQCDHPEHKRDKLRHPDATWQEAADFYDVDPDTTKREYLADYRAQGFIFHRDGRVTCPECAKLRKPAA